MAYKHPPAAPVEWYLPWKSSLSVISGHEQIYSLTPELAFIMLVCSLLDIKLNWAKSVGIVDETLIILVIFIVKARF